jgi:hypothetical protein
MRGAARDGRIFEERGIAQIGTEPTMIGKTVKDLMNLGNKPLKAQHTSCAGMRIQRLKHVYLLNIKWLYRCPDYDVC